jgi:uncharacterized protein (DUF1499 family)
VTVRAVLRRALGALAGLALATVVAGQLGHFGGAAPADLGVHEGRLKPPASTPNSVSSQAGLWPAGAGTDYARIEPIALRGDGPATMARLKSIVERMPGARIVAARPDYLYVQFTTKLMRFVDDTEFWFDPAAGVIHVRSASRIGGKDFGVNRARIEAIRERLNS